ncbi:MAG: LysR family transcriptional regulator [Deltaproteobacteria bacterium]|nr:LysR family transcriptional regulator [Deltaproteobacteria bacterium]
MKLGPLPISLRQLQYAVAIDEVKSFRRAAELCRVSQPSLSSQLAELESALGVRLFERDRRRVLPTGPGKELLDRARRVLLEAEDLALAARRLGDPLAGTLRVGVIPTISPYLLPDVVPALRASLPSLEVIWIEDKTEVLVRRLGAGELDAALLALEAPIGQVDSEVVVKDPFVLAAPPGHPLLRRRSPAKLAELRGTKVLLLDDGHCLRDQALSICSAAEAQELGFRATSLSTLTQMVAGGAGITLLPRLAVRTETRRADLVVRPFAQPAPHRTVALVWRPRSPLGPPLRQVASILRKACGGVHSSRRRDR